MTKIQELDIDSVLGAEQAASHVNHALQRAAEQVSVYGPDMPDAEWKVSLTMSITPHVYSDGTAVPVVKSSLEFTAPPIPERRALGGPVHVEAQEDQS